jgi:hypothetical protein
MPSVFITNRLLFRREKRKMQLRIAGAIILMHKNLNLFFTDEINDIIYHCHVPSTSQYSSHARSGCCLIFYRVKEIL